MFNRMKSALYNVMGGLDALPQVRDGEPAGADKLPLKFKYTRPNFLQLASDDEIQVSADHVIRPIIVPRDITKIPWNSGYAETINAGKSLRNEDQGAVYRGAVRRHVSATPALGNSESKSPTSKRAASKLPTDVAKDQGDTILNTPSEPPVGSETDSFPQSSSNVEVEQILPWVYFALFDGHAGSGVAVAASNTLQKIIQEKLMNVIDLLMPAHAENGNVKDNNSMFLPFGEKKVTPDSLIIGALETAFWDMDNQIARDKKHYKMTGGCTVLVALFIMGKLYVANAGDSRAIICRGNKVIPMSLDFTPESERSRIKHLGMHRPELLGNDFTYLEFIRRPVRADIGKRMLCKDAYMTGWAYKTITVDDLKFPLIYGEGKRSRVLATIGVTRGFGDHDLKAQSSSVDIKPFLSAEPEVRVFDISAEELTESDVLVMGTDGLWDVLSNEKVCEITQKSLDHFPANDTQRYKFRYISAAQDLVMNARGKLKERNWRTAENKAATIDDISVFVIPLKSYKEEYEELKAASEPHLAIPTHADKTAQVA
ncbi:protein phosphatase 1H-like [Ornithodoros turicata]|uniref:protein phosphatase 1H-like n=1 Tax=Ornithodoros turicata TaxID=34597 RepID=UPI00313A426E